MSRLVMQFPRFPRFSPSPLFSFRSISFKSASPYSILGIPENATQKEIKSAFYKLASELHPDKNPETRKNQKLKEKFTKICEAYEILGNVDKRRQWDNRPSEVSDFYNYNNQDWSGPPPHTFYHQNHKVDWKHFLDDLFIKYEKDPHFNPDFKTPEMLQQEEQDRKDRKKQFRIFLSIFTIYLILHEVRVWLQRNRELYNGIERNVLIWDEEAGTFRRKDRIGKPLDESRVNER